MKHRVYILLGGLYSFDGPITSSGMYGLAGQIRKLPNVDVKVSVWANFYQFVGEIERNILDRRKTIIIGYSGGGAKATWLANGMDINMKYSQGKPLVDLLIGYDPSPKWQILPLRHNVKRAICYWNTSPLMLGLGGGKFYRNEGNIQTRLDTVKISEQHLAVQFDQGLHKLTIAKIREETTNV